MVDNTPNNFEILQKDSLEQQIFIKMIASMQEALKLLTKTTFLLIVIVSENVEYLPYLKLMRDMMPIPILVLAPTYNASEKMRAIQLGADEYLAYPSTSEEILASVKALIRRYTILNQQTVKPLTIITYREIFICAEYRKLFLKSTEIKLTRKEFDMLCLLFSSIGRVYSHEQIYRNIWNDDTDSVSTEYAVWCLVSRVRKKLRVVSNEFEYIKTVRDVGYCIDMVME